ncbi:MULTISPECIES: HD-GYP domain-containing protein [unclassified Fusibacter]|uniref:HD-GYP domain-containing protein n=1 Tax=unclassified Fusibacter TaxID=2624464 RepID=UPI0010100FFD|nr:MULTISPECIES: HD-GYP domain-containing protein [unclassified Fusibacter]MCK8059431.1 HD-GYP domain-containing protein [Fusibacter sp. A2]NPE21105.1 HD-GYP domain-containing protein [Fusibacter sp. A1]RXV62375.1 HD-GYP domain-containing protein [Fusibacter sp. A1]
MDKISFKIYYATVLSFGSVVLIASALSLSMVPVWKLIGYIGLAILIESLTIEIEANRYISLGFAIGLAGMIIFDPVYAGLMTFLGALFHVEFENGKYLHLFNTSLLKRLFNSCADASVALLSGALYHYCLNNSIGWTVSGINIIGVIAAILTYITLNITLFSLLFAFVLDTPILKVLRQNLWLFSKFLGIAPIGILMAVTQMQLGFFIVLLFLGPLLLARFTFVQYLKMKDVYIKTINSFTKAIDAKDKYTVGHSERVADYSVKLAKRMKFGDKKIDDLRTSALLHDIGKIGILDAILNKPGKLTEEEYNEIKKHPEIGASIINEIYFLKNASEVIRHHHESYDGTGYPDGLKGDEIPLEAAIITVVDAYDAMTSDRSYRKALTHDQAMKNLVDASGRQFNPRVVDAFIELMSKVTVDEVRENVG